MELNEAIRIQTERLILKPVQELNVDDINAHFTAELTKYMPFIPTGDRSDILFFVHQSQKQLQNNTDLVLAVHGLNKEFIGCCGIHNITPESAEVGLWIKKSMQGFGFGTEIIKSLIEFIEINFKARFIIYPVDEDNTASRRIPEKLGFIIYKKYQKPKDKSSCLNIVEYRKYTQFNSKDRL